MAGGKWIHELKPDMKLADAAQRVLGVRLGVVGDYLPLALHEPEKDPENVHQLRVGTRRARAALDIFSVCLSERMYKKVKKSLRRIRRAAGAARDWDVFLAGLVEWGQGQSPRRRTGLNFLLGYSMAQRTVAQVQLEQLDEEDPRAFGALVASTLDAVRQPEAPYLVTLGDLARPLLTGLLDELDQAVAGDLTDYNHLHQVRIVGKRLRYAMEVFAECYPAPFRDEFYPAVEQMQETLGTANDSHVASERLRAVAGRMQGTLPDDWKRFKPGVEALITYHEERLGQQRQQFQEWWNEWRKSAGEAIHRMVLEQHEARTV